jgi:hypothetical protein
MRLGSAQYGQSYKYVLFLGTAYKWPVRTFGFQSFSIQFIFFYYILSDRRDLFSRFELFLLALEVYKLDAFTSR